MTTGRRRDEGGYTLALTALLILPLMAIAALGVDVGVWYLQGQRNQRAADAAALAGVVLLPDEVAAEAAAIEATRLNGLDPGVDSTVTATAVGSGQLKVSVSTKSLLSFSNLFIDEFAVTRSAIAEYKPPVAMGSPQNQLGDPALWLAVSGRCSVRENGDLRLARHMNGYPGGAYPPGNCTGTTNPDYDANGYLFAVEVPPTASGAIHIEAYDATLSGSSTPDLFFAPNAQFNTVFTLFDNGGTPFDLAGQPVLSSTTVGTSNSWYEGQWRTVGRIDVPSPGTYYLRVHTTGGGAQSHGSNGFALRARTGSSFTSCSTLSDPNCIQVAAVTGLPLYASLSGGSSTFYLAEIDGTEAGKQLQIELFDVGEGADSIEVLDPNGDPVTFDWSIDCGSGGMPIRGCSGSGTALDVSGSDTKVSGNTLGDSRFNDRVVTIQVDLPTDYATRYAGRWWQIRYTFGAADITDRTTWSIQVLGDPVRLAG